MNINVGLKHTKVVQFIFNNLYDVLKFLVSPQLKVQYWRPRSEYSSPIQAQLVTVLRVIIPTSIITKSSPLQEGKHAFIEYTRRKIPYALKWLSMSPRLENMLTHIYG